jgi:hypothetical protein
MPELASIPGMFDTIHVVDTFPARKVFTCGKLQGCLLFDPPADHLYPQCSCGPGPVTDTTYQLAWLMAGARHPKGRGLMLGLGAGSGAVALLHHFPEISLEVVEIDPDMIKVARRYFPLVSYFEQGGRLKVINDDASSFLSGNPSPYDFALIDISVDGAKAQQLLLSSTFAESLTRVADEIWINALTSREKPFLANLVATHAGLTNLFSSESLSAWLPIERNWIATSANVDLDASQALRLYPGIATESAQKARRLYATLVTHHMSCAGMSEA